MVRANGRQMDLTLVIFRQKIKMTNLIPTSREEFLLENKRRIETYTQRTKFTPTKTNVKQCISLHQCSYYQQFNKEVVSFGMCIGACISNYNNGIDKTECCICRLLNTIMLHCIFISNVNQQCLLHTTCASSTNDQVTPSRGYFHIIPIILWIFYGVSWKCTRMTCVEGSGKLIHLLLKFLY